jgi:hypothetical protein
MCIHPIANILVKAAAPVPNFGVFTLGCHCLPWIYKHFATEKHRVIWHAFLDSLQQECMAMCVCFTGCTPIGIGPCLVGDQGLKHHRACAVVARLLYPDAPVEGL